MSTNFFNKRFNVTTHQQNQRNTKLFPIQFHSKQLTCLGEILTASKFIKRILSTLTICALFLGANSANAGITILNIPTTIQADGYSNAAGVKNEPTTDVGGGNDTGSIDAGDWMSYLNRQVVIPANGYYYVYFRVSSLRGGGSFVFNDIASSVTKLDTVAVPQTNGWQTWTTVQRKIYLKSGPHYFGVQAITSGFNLNWFQITTAATATLPAALSGSSAVSSKSSVKSSSSSSKSSVASSIKSSANSSFKASVASSVKSVAVSSAKASSSSSVKAVASSSVKSSIASSSKAASAALDPLYTHVAGPVALSWIAPKLRADKTILDITELGGYQIRYKLLADKAYNYVTISDAWTTIYNFSWLEGDYVFQVAAFDKTGALSDFAYFTD